MANIGGAIIACQGVLCFERVGRDAVEIPLLMGFDEKRDKGGEILDDAHIGHVENRRFGIRVDGNDKTGPPHA